MGFSDQLLGLLADQREALTFITSHPRTFVPAAVRWVERLGGGLGSPVGPFFLLALNLSPSQMGQLSSIGTIAAVLPAPLFGYCQDRFGPFYTIVFGAASCGIGCGLQGFAPDISWLIYARIFQGMGGGNLPFVINAHITACTPVEKRALVLSAFAAQCLVVPLAGQLLYLPWDWMLGALDLPRMLRFRTTLSVCTFFCWFGVVALLHSGKHLRQRVVDSQMPSEDEQSPKKPDTVASSASASACEATAASASPLAMSGTFCLAVVSGLVFMFLVGFYEALLHTTWPLFIATHYGWHEHQFAPLLFASTATSALSLAAYPRLHAAIEGPLAVLLLSCIMAVGSAAAYAVQAPSLAAYHVALMLIGHGSLSALSPAILALVSTIAPAEAIGRLFAAMNVGNALGRVAAGVLGARAFEYSMQLEGSGGTFGVIRLPEWMPVLVGGGALPLMLLAPLMLGCAAAVCFSITITTAMARSGGKMSAELV